jgi:hypothetical protein
MTERLRREDPCLLEVDAHTPDVHLGMENGSTPAGVARPDERTRQARG